MTIGIDGPLGYSAIRDWALAFPDDPPEEVAQTYIEGVSPDAIWDFAVQHVVEWIEHVRRAAAREVEAAAQRAVHPAPPPSPPRDFQAEAREGRQRLEREKLGRAKERGLVPADATKLTREQREALKDSDRQEKERALEAEFGPVRDEPEAYAHRFGPYAAQRARLDAFVAWMGDERYAQWYAEHRDRLAGRSRMDLVTFRQRYGARVGDETSFYDAIMAYTEDVKDRVRLELTEDLLATSFALGNGERVTWGAASVTEHRQRMALLARQAAGNVETAARHQAAVGMIEEAGVSCLAECQAVPAAA